MSTLSPASPLRQGYMNDWFVVDGAPFGVPEGNAQEWRDAIAFIRQESGQQRSGRQFGRRLFVMVYRDRVEFWSPRNANSTEDVATLPIAHVEEWITHAEAVLRFSGKHVT